LSLKKSVDEVTVNTPAGLKVSLPVVAKGGLCVAKKNGGDHQFDVTKGLEIVASARLAEKTDLLPGEGVGKIMADGLCAEIGKPAISRVCKKAINPSNRRRAEGDRPRWGRG